MLTIIGIIVCCCAIWVAARLMPRIYRLEEAVIKQQEQLTYLTLYAQWLEENALDLMDEMHILQDILANDYPEPTDPPQPDYPTAYDKWGEFDV